MHQQKSNADSRVLKPVKSMSLILPKIHQEMTKAVFKVRAKRAQNSLDKQQPIK